jgi:TonB family protein
MGRGLVTLDLEEPPPPPPPDEMDAGPGPITGPLTAPRARPGGMAFSAILHGLVVMLAVQAAIVHAPEPPKPAAPVEPKAAVFLPPPAEVRKMLNLRATPPPPPPPRPQSGKDRMSVGAPSSLQAKDRIIKMDRDIDLTAVPKGTPNVGTAAAAPAPPPPPATRPPGTATPMEGRLVPKVERPAIAPGPILASLRRLEASGTAGDPGPMGAVTGTGGRLNGLDFDPQGADFTEWAQRFKNEIYRNWIVPPAAALGWGGGEVEFQFVVDRSGTVSDVAMLSSSGIAAYDRAARNALLSSRLFTLPADYAPATLTIRAIFSYGPPRSSEVGHSGR